MNQCDSANTSISTRRPRTAFTLEQIKELEQVFEVSPHIDMLAQEELARKINLTAKCVKVWFSNRRAKCRLQTRRVLIVDGTNPTPPGKCEIDDLKNGLAQLKYEFDVRINDLAAKIAAYEHRQEFINK